MSKNKGYTDYRSAFEETVVEEETAPVVEEVKEEIPVPQPVSGSTVTVVPSVLNVRMKPNQGSSVLKTVHKGEKLSVDNNFRNDEWTKLTNGGYVMSKFVS